MKRTITIPSFTLPQPTRKNLIISGLALATLCGGFFGYRHYQWNKFLVTCKDARDVRAEARRLMVRSTLDTFTYGTEMAVVSSDAADLYQQANVIVRRCDSKGA